MNLHPFVPMGREVFFLQHIAATGEAVFGDYILSQGGEGVHEVDFLPGFNARGDVPNHLVDQIFQDRLQSPNVRWGEELAKGSPTHLMKIMPNGTERHLIVAEHSS